MILITGGKHIIIDNFKCGGKQKMIMITGGKWMIIDNWLLYNDDNILILMIL